MKAFFSIHSGPGMLSILLFLALAVLLACLYLNMRVRGLLRTSRATARPDTQRLKEYLNALDSCQIDRILEIRKKRHSGNIPPGIKGPGIKPPGIKSLTILFFAQALFRPMPAMAQPAAKAAGSIWNETGVVIMLILIAIPVLAGILVLVSKALGVTGEYRKKKAREEAALLADYLAHVGDTEIAALMARKKVLDYRLTNTELSGDEAPEDNKGLLANVGHEDNPAFVPQKKKAPPRPPIQQDLARLILWFLGSATFWLVVGTTVGEYLGIKFVSPDVDHVSWLSFGRLRPVHTNIVFWGWSSLAMLGLAYYVVPRVGNGPLASLKKGWWSLCLINSAVVLGTLSLMGGINNAGGEYREWLWPVMLLFVVALLLTLVNFLQTIAKRTTKEIYISNWYIVSAIIFTAVIVTVAYLPFWQDGLGETIIQGYYMHQAVGMWFMLFTLGLVYYFLPQQLNRPIYSYSLGILAFWTQILFYTVIGTHHFEFSSIPWWLQTVAIVGSVGMIIPVAAGTTNFLMTFRASRHKLSSSYTLPFFFVGVIFYFTGSMQGTAEAFRSTNLIWHFTDFTVAHSHMTMYGIISFLVWAGIYAMVPRLTGKEPPQLAVGAHFWLALTGLLFYTVPLMYGATLKGLMWMEGKPFIDGVAFMAPYWLWRAIGGSLMWTSHLLFAYNMYKMLVGARVEDVKEMALERLHEDDENTGASLSPLNQ